MPVWIETSGITTKQKTNQSFPTIFLTQDLPSQDMSPFIDPNQFILRRSLDVHSKGKYEIVAAIGVRQNKIDLQKMGDPEAPIYTITKADMDLYYEKRKRNDITARRGLRLRYFQNSKWQSGWLDIQ